MIILKNKATQATIGEISEEQLKFLVDELVEESATDQDYYLNRDGVEQLETRGADAELVKLLQEALGENRDVEIVWSRA